MLHKRSNYCGIFSHSSNLRVHQYLINVVLWGIVRQSIVANHESSRVSDEIKLLLCVPFRAVCVCIYAVLSDLNNCWLRSPVGRPERKLVGFPVRDFQSKTDRKLRISVRDFFRLHTFLRSSTIGNAHDVTYFRPLKTPSVGLVDGM